MSNINSTNIYKSEIINDIETKIIGATLRNNPYACPHCRSNKINIHGYKVSDIKIPPVSEYNAILMLKKQRYQCQHCKKTFMVKKFVLYPIIPKMP